MEVKGDIFYLVPCHKHNTTSCCIFYECLSSSVSYSVTSSCWQSYGVSFFWLEGAIHTFLVWKITRKIPFVQALSFISSTFILLYQIYCNNRLVPYVLDKQSKNRTSKIVIDFSPVSHVTFHLKCSNLLCLTLKTCSHRMFQDPLISRSCFSFLLSLSQLVSVSAQTSKTVTQA